jgi:hypothetical protein
MLFYRQFTNVMHIMVVKLTWSRSKQQGYHTYDTRRLKPLAYEYLDGTRVPLLLPINQCSGVGVATRPAVTTRPGVAHLTTSGFC